MTSKALPSRLTNPHCLFKIAQITGNFARMKLDTPDPTGSYVNPAPYRARGTLSLSSKPGPNGSVLDNLRLSGSLKALFPRPRSSDLDVVTLNTAGGVTSGDHFTTQIHAAANTQITVTTQAAERIYKTATQEIGTVSTSLKLGKGAQIQWLPQETILFNQARLSRTIHADLDESSSLLLVEPLVFGRHAMGEQITELYFNDQWRIKRGGKLVYADATRINGNCKAILSGEATGNTAGAYASILLIDPNTDAKLKILRAHLPETAGASLIRKGVLSARILAPDSFTLRKSLVPLITNLTNSPIPKTWML